LPENLIFIQPANKCSALMGPEGSLGPVVRDLNPGHIFTPCS